MKKRIISLLAISIMIIISITCLTACSNQTMKKDGTYTIMTSFYPVYIMTKNITQGAPIELVNMTQNTAGCLHDYTLATKDLMRIEEANVFVQNGLGIEGFIDKIKTTYSNMPVIDSSAGITNVIKEGEGSNGHIWTSIQNYKKQVQNIAKELEQKNPENATIYQKNTEQYLLKIDALEKEFQKLTLKDKSAVCLNEAFEYLGKELGMNLVSIETDHEESTISAQTLKDVIDTVKEKNITAIWIDKNDNEQNANLIAKETNAKIYRLDAAMVGEDTKDSYILAMQYNLEILKSME